MLWTGCGPKHGRAIKLWMSFKLLGVDAIRNYMRNGNRLCKLYEKLIDESEYFEVFTPTIGSLVTLKVKNVGAEENKGILDAIQSDRRVHLTASDTNGTYYIRIILSPIGHRDQDVAFFMKVITEVTKKYLDNKPASPIALTEGKKLRPMHTIALNTKNICKSRMQVIFSINNNGVCI
uniref:Tyrosine decarboxylase 1-like n=1 Tax=Rhabditophanes sp. KR3021 TaxID=114890 RepID=A0AC35TGH8_9BILA